MSRLENEKDIKGDIEHVGSTEYLESQRRLAQNINLNVSAKIQK